MSRRTKKFWKQGTVFACAGILAWSALYGDGRAELPREEESGKNAGGAIPNLSKTDLSLERAKAALLRKRGDACKNDEEAFNCYLKAAEYGDPAGMRKLACCYDMGGGVEKDENLALELYLRAAELGDLDALLELAIYYTEGDYVEKDEKKVVEFARRAADAGRAWGFSWLAQSYFEGSGVEKDEKKGFELITQAAKLDSDLWQLAAECYAFGRGVERDDEKAFEICSRSKNEADFYILGKLYRDGAEGIPEEERIPGNPTAAFRCFEKSATLGDDEAREMLEKFYREGYGVEKDEDKARVWERISTLNELGDEYFHYGFNRQGENQKAALTFYEEAAKLGDFGATRKLADAYYWGNGVEEDKTKALEILLRAAKEGDIIAREEILDRSWAGDGELSSPEKDAWLRQELASLGDARATCELAERYFFGAGVPECRTLAFNLYLKAEELGSGKATECLAYCYAAGWGVEQNKEKAYEKARESGALPPLAYCYASGCGVERNDEKAWEICNKMKDQATWSWLGGLCRDGAMDVPQNPTFAVRCFEEAASLGDGEACLELAKCYREGFGVEKDEAKAAEWEKIGNELERLEGVDLIRA